MSQGQEAIESQMYNMYMHCGPLQDNTVIVNATVTQTIVYTCIAYMYA